MRIILASGSPRRLELLEAAGFEVLVQKPDVDESELPSETPKDLVLRLSKE